MMPSTSRLLSGPSGKRAADRSRRASRCRPRSRPSSAWPRRTPPGRSGTSPPPAPAGRTPDAAASGPARRRSRAVRRGIVTASDSRRRVSACSASAIARRPRSDAARAAHAAGIDRASHQRAARRRGARRRSPPPARRVRAPAPPGRLSMPRRLRRIHHVDRQHHRPAELAHFQREAQVQAQVGGIDHADQHVGRRLAGIEAAAQVAGDRFVQAGGMQAVGARQVQQRVAAARRRVEAAFLALDGDAGVVGDLLPAAGQQVEQRGLAAVGIADQREAQRRWPAALMRRPPRRKRTRAASARRSAKRVKPTCTSSGSAPNGPGGHDFDLLAGDEAQLAQAARDGVVAARGLRRVRRWRRCGAAVRSASRPGAQMGIVLILASPQSHATARQRTAPAIIQRRFPARPAAHDANTLRAATATGAVARLRLNRPTLHNAFDAGLIAALTAALDGLGRRRRRARGGAGRRRRLVLRRRRPQLDARHGRAPARPTNREDCARPRPPDAHAGRTAQADHRPRARRGLRRRRRPGRLLRHRHRRAGGEVRPDRKQAGPAAGGDLALRDRRDRRAPGAALVRHRRDLRRRRSAAHRPAARGGRRRPRSTPPCSARSTCC